MYEHFDLFMELKEPLSPGCIAKDFSRKTIVFFDGPMEVKTTKDATMNVNSLDYLSKEQMIKAMGDFGIRFVLFTKDTGYEFWSTCFKENIEKIRSIDHLIDVERNMMKRSLVDRMLS